MGIYEISFWIFFFIAVAGGVYILVSKNILYAAFVLMVVFLSLAGIYILANAEFVAITQILVYVGGILILLIFGIMLTNRIDGNKIISRIGNTLFGGLISISVFMILYLVILKSVSWGDFYLNELNGANNTQKIGIQLMTSKVLVLEMAGILLLIALIGAAFMARKEFDIKD